MDSVYKERIKVLKLLIKDSEERKKNLTEADEIKAVNKQINQFQKEIKDLKKQIEYENCIEREFATAHSDKDDD